MQDPYNLQRFLTAQNKDYNTALSEIRKGRKRSHWMWYIFPQIQGLGFSSTSKYYAITSRNEAQAYIKHPDLGNRLIEISNALVSLPGNNATVIFGIPDDVKLRSCMTLFASLPDANPVFNAVLHKFFKGNKDSATLGILTHHQ